MTDMADRVHNLTIGVILYSMSDCRAELEACKVNRYLLFSHSAEQDSSENIKAAEIAIQPGELRVSLLRSCYY